MDHIKTDQKKRKMSSESPENFRKSLQRLKISENGDASKDQPYLTQVMREEIKIIVKASIEESLLEIINGNQNIKSEKQKCDDISDRRKKAVEFADNHSNVEGARKFGVTEGAIRKWKIKLNSQNGEEKKTKNPNASSSGKKKTTPFVELEVRIRKYICIALILLFNANRNP